MTSTTSPVSTRGASQSAVDSAEPGALAGVPRAATASRQVRGGRDRRVRVATGVDVGDHDAVRPGQDVGERLEHRRGPVEGQRLVDRPGPAARIAQRDGVERRRHGRRVMPVVVEDDDPADLALELEPPADAGERAQPVDDRRGVGSVGQRRAGRYEPVLGVVAPDQAEVGDLGIVSVDPVTDDPGRPVRIGLVAGHQPGGRSDRRR